jgi:hypothetical protein
MSRPAPRTARRQSRPRSLARLLATAGLALATTLGTLAAAPAQAREGNVVTPGDFTGYGFDQCLAPTQAAMDAWLTSSPFLAVGIYISGDSRACRSQPNLTPTWVGRQLAAGWRLLPITLGPQASCQPRFPRYGNDETISPARGTTGTYPTARRQGRAEAAKAVTAAQALGIVAGSTLWYDLEGFDNRLTDCRESALAFLSAWTYRIHALGYLSGVYSSASSGIKVLDDARATRPAAFNLPDQIWIARWDGVADTSTSYIGEDGWKKARVKQYKGGHDETWGGVRINIDSNFLDLGRGSYAAPETHCGGVRISFRDYPRLRPATATSAPAPSRVRALQCRLQEEGLYTGKVTGVFSERTIAAANAWQSAHGLASRRAFGPTHWVTLLSAGPRPVLKTGSAGVGVRSVQRSLNAAGATTRLAVSGVWNDATVAALKAWQARQGLPATGIMAASSWSALQAGRR